MRSVGINPGHEGCICMLDSEAKTARYYYLCYEKNKIIHGKEIDIRFECFAGVSVIIMEKNQGTKNLPPDKNFGNGRNYGQMLMYVGYYDHFLVSPSTWQRSPTQYSVGVTTRDRLTHTFNTINPNFGQIQKSEIGLMDSFFIAKYGFDLKKQPFPNDWEFINMK